MKLAIVILLFCAVSSRAQVRCVASWYDAPALNGSHMTCAAWQWQIGTQLRVTEVHNGLSVIVTVNDRGPHPSLARKGRRIDLSREAFAQIDGLELGLADVRVEEVPPVFATNAVLITFLKK